MPRSCRVTGAGFAGAAAVAGTGAITGGGAVGATAGATRVLGTTGGVADRPGAEVVGGSATWREGPGTSADMAARRADPIAGAGTAACRDGTGTMTRAGGALSPVAALGGAGAKGALAGSGERSLPTTA
jgi:hypothetical protein